MDNCYSHTCKINQPRTPAENTKGYWYITRNIRATAEKIKGRSRALLFFHTIWLSVSTKNGTRPFILFPSKRRKAKHLFPFGDKCFHRLKHRGSFPFNNHATILTHHRNEPFSPSNRTPEGKDTFTKIRIRLSFDGTFRARADKVSLPIFISLINITLREVTKAYVSFHIYTPYHCTCPIRQ